MGARGCKRGYIRFKEVNAINIKEEVTQREAVLINLTYFVIGITIMEFDGILIRDIGINVDASMA